jgi:hypothetical protein
MLLPDKKQARSAIESVSADLAFVQSGLDRSVDDR